MYGLSAAEKDLDEEDNTKAEAAKMQKEYENLKDSTKEEQQPTTETSQSTTHYFTLLYITCHYITCHYMSLHYITNHELCKLHNPFLSFCIKMLAFLLCQLCMQENA